MHLFKKVGSIPKREYVVVLEEGKQFSKNLQTSSNILEQQKNTRKIPVPRS